MVKLVKLTRDSGYLARDEFLAICKGDHTLICMDIFANVLLHYVVCVGYFQS